MPVLKPISGHTSAAPAMRYLTKQNRALAADYINMDAPSAEHERIKFDWAAAMDETRREYGNDVPWRGMRVRTYKHYIVSPDPKDRIDLDSLRKLATTWATGHFGDYEVAIVYHDDNERGIPHAHVVVNNTNLSTGRRLQDPDPKALNHSLQRMAADQNLRHFSDTAELRGVTARAEAISTRVRPKSLQSEYMRKAEAELVSKGAYSWTADIRARVRIARTVARNEAEFRGALSAMGVTISNNSPKAPRSDWIYSLADHPTRRVTGEKLGLSYGRERLLSSFALNGTGHLPDRSEREIARIAKSALEVGGLGELNRLSRAVSLIEANGITSVKDLHRLAEKGYEKQAWTDPELQEATELIGYIEQSGILPEQASAPKARTPASRREDDSRHGSRNLADKRRSAQRQHDAPSRNQPARDHDEKGQQR